MMDSQDNWVERVELEDLTVTVAVTVGAAITVVGPGVGPAVTAGLELDEVGCAVGERFATQYS